MFTNIEQNANIEKMRKDMRMAAFAAGVGALALCLRLGH